MAAQRAPHLPSHSESALANLANPDRELEPLSSAGSETASMSASWRSSSALAACLPSGTLAASSRKSAMIAPSPNRPRQARHPQPARQAASPARRGDLVRVCKYLAFLPDSGSLPSPLIRIQGNGLGGGDPQAIGGLLQ
jgi:hypothetical protein